MAKVYKAKIRGEEGTEMQTGKVRLSFPYLFETYKDNNGDDTGKYKATLLIDKGDTMTLPLVKKLFDKAKEDGKTRLWKGKIPKGFIDPLYDGDDKDFDGYADHYYLNAKTGWKPKVTDETGEEIFDQEDIYGGCYVRAVLKFLPYDNSSKGVMCILERLQKLEDGERFGGSAADFDDDDEDDDDDLGI